MRKPTIAIKLTPRMYGALADLGNTVIKALTGHIHYTSPSPSLATLQTAVTNVKNAIKKWGQQSNRGSHDDLMDLRLKARILHDMLKAEAQYVQNTAQAIAGTDYEAMRQILSTGGFALTATAEPQGILEKVQELHQFISRQLNHNTVKLRWKKPLNVERADAVKHYKVLRSDNTELSTAVEIGSVTRTTFTDTNNSANAVEWTYWIVPYNSAGAGVVSDPITVKVLGV